MTQSACGTEYAAWQADPVGWWERQAEALLWRQRWTRGFDPALGAFGQYFAGGTLKPWSQPSWPPTAPPTATC